MIPRSPKCLKRDTARAHAVCCADGEVRVASLQPHHRMHSYMGIGPWGEHAELVVMRLDKHGYIRPQPLAWETQTDSSDDDKVPQALMALK